MLGASLGAPQGSPFLEAPSPKGSLDAESKGGAGEPHALSVPAGAEAEGGDREERLRQDKTMIKDEYFRLMALLFLW